MKGNYERAMLEAKATCKTRFDFHCIVTDTPRLTLHDWGQDLDACHIFPAGKSDYIELRLNPDNMLPMARRLHKYFDSINEQTERPPIDKILWLYHRVHAHHRQQVREQLERLSAETNRLGIKV